MKDSSRDETFPMLLSSKIHTLIGHTAEVSSAQFNWDCSRIVTGSMDKTCKLWDALSGKINGGLIEFEFELS